MVRIYPRRITLEFAVIHMNEWSSDTVKHSSRKDTKPTSGLNLRTLHASWRERCIVRVRVEELESTNRAHVTNSLSFGSEFR
jgi:hypothetical protein